MNFLSKTFLLINFCLLSSISIADSGHLKGKVEYLRVHDAENQSWVPPVFWFSIEGVSAAGSCGLWQGRPIFVGEDNNGGWLDKITVGGPRK